MFKHDLEVIDALRRDAVNVREPHPSGIKKLQAYAGQLVWVGGKFPIDVSVTRCQLTAQIDNDERLEPSFRGILPLDTIPSVLWCETT
jgi:programmed cell death 6-interacting protein